MEPSQQSKTGDWPRTVNCPELNTLLSLHWTSSYCSAGMPIKISNTLKSSFFCSKRLESIKLKMLPKGMNGFKYSQETDLKVSQVRVSLLQWVLLQNPDLA